MSRYRVVKQDVTEARRLFCRTMKELDSSEEGEVVVIVHRRGDPLVVITDSAYLQRGASRWLRGWIRKGWRTQTGKVKNADLWRRLLCAQARHHVSWQKVRGHSGHVLNERADALAEQEARKAGSCRQPSFIKHKRRKRA